MRIDGMRHSLGRLACAVAGLSFALPVTAGRIDGLPLQQALVAHAVVPVVMGERMTVALSDGNQLVVTPWPRFLPQRFDKQSIEGERKLLPSGPVDRLSFVRTNETTPWLYVGNGARPSSLLIGEWRLQLHGKLWTASDGASVRKLGHDRQDAMPAILESNRERWCLYLVDSSMPTQMEAHIANEEEPQVMWVARKLDRRNQRCTQPR